MKKTTLWTMFGLGLAAACGLAGLAHLSATLMTLTVFLSVPAYLVPLLDMFDRSRSGL